MYVSTRGGERVTASEAIVKGLACDGGLFVPETTQKIDFDETYIGADYRTFAKKIFAAFFDDFTLEEIDEVISLAYNSTNFSEKIACVNTVINGKTDGVGGKDRFGDLGGFSILELYHGPTAAFKDMALTALPHLLNVAKRKISQSGRTLVLVATSGDTGGAALSAFGTAKGYDTLVLYPDGGVSDVQERQMLHYTNARTNALAIDGNFDDCQSFVKRIFASYPTESENGVTLCSANSINIGRLVPQVTYYVYAYFELVKSGVIRYGETIDAVVPTGNFGDIFAGYMAKQLGVPYGTFVCASNENNVLADFFATGTYDKNRPFFKTDSPAMDILVSSNLERLLYFASNKNPAEVKGYMDSLAKCGRYEISAQTRSNLSDFAYGYTTNEQTKRAIWRAYSDYGVLIDPHTAVAFDCYSAFKQSEKGAYRRHTLIVSTASPFKFVSTMCEALRLPVGEKAEGDRAAINRLAEYTGQSVPSRIAALFSEEKRRHVASKEEVENRVYYRRGKITVRVPATSANLACAFDCAGLALTAYNAFVFEQAEQDDVSDFAFVGEEKENLLLRAYKKFFERTGEKYVPVRITRGAEQNVPFERGLGSSATCIVAGVLAANHFTYGKANEELLLSVMNEIEGHPDNVAAAYLGGLACCIVENGNVSVKRYKVNDRLKFTALLPPFCGSTEEARKALPNRVDLQDAVYTLSRAIRLPSALERGDEEELKRLFSDKLHQPYRLPLICGGAELKKKIEDSDFAVAISGAGPTLLAVGKEYAALPEEYIAIGWKAVQLCAAETGAEVISQ